MYSWICSLLSVHELSQGREGHGGAYGTGSQGLPIPLRYLTSWFPFLSWYVGLIYLEKNLFPLCHNFCLWGSGESMEAHGCHNITQLLRDHGVQKLILVQTLCLSPALLRTPFCSFLSKQRPGETKSSIWVEMEHLKMQWFVCTVAAHLFMLW